MSENFIDRYTKDIADYTDAPDVFIRASAYFLTSSLLGRYFRCPYLPLIAKPNVWFIISSIPGAMRRSTIQNLANYVYRKTYEKYLVEFEETSPEEAKEKVEGSLIEEGTVEGILDHINQTKLKEYCIVSLEFGSVLKRMSVRDYELGVSSIFSKMYYGEGGSMYLSQRGGKAGVRRLPEGLYVTMLAGMQEPKQYLTPDMIKQDF